MERACARWQWPGRRAAFIKAARKKQPMAGRKKIAKTEHDWEKAEKTGYGVLVSALGCIWLLAETGYLQTNIPMGPLIIIIIGLATILPALRN